MPGLFNVDIGSLGGLAKDLRAAFTGKEILDPAKQLEFVARAQDQEVAIMKLRSEVIVAEASSQHVITSTWRPITMLVFVFIIANNYIIVPYLNILFSVTIPCLVLSQEMWELLNLGMGGYIIGRSVEQGIKAWKAPK